MGPVRTRRLLWRRSVRWALLGVLAVIAASVVIHHPAPVADHGDGHHHAISELLLCVALAGAALLSATAAALTSMGGTFRPSSVSVPRGLPAPAVPAPRARAGPPGRHSILRM
ncbi:hypothetical protein GKE82_25430 [Conexibacter sp. W3-3-2]|uniref:hypothetical protein n=1 Tax=Conexibacter sp. W3-3-2 TaxID=2675227 RepID=UPI0012B773C5|nr:hypothetical protein [Conexibacter sp. W3-3-2]MTD47550.1 hypothetical protein [Conexibacter sp. W3-3-2]